MSVFDEYNLSPGAVASLTEPTPDLQRNYRGRGMMDDYGQADDKGRWKYSLRDLVGMWIADRLSHGGKVMDRRDALRFGCSIAPSVISAFFAFKRGRVPFGEAAQRFTVMLHDGFDGDMRVHGSEVADVSALAEIEIKEFDYAEVIDLHRLAKTIPPEIQGLLVAAAENEAEDLVPDMSGLDD